MGSAFYERLEVFAERVVMMYNLSIPIDVRGLVRRLDIDLHEAPFPATFSGALCPYPELPGEYLILLNSLHSETRKRFTLAHELAHYFLHEPEAVAAKARRMWSNIQEREAEAFAARLLMPRGAVLDACKKFGADTRVLAYRFWVSQRAMEIRMAELRLNGNQEGKNGGRGP